MEKMIEYFLEEIKEIKAENEMLKSQVKFYENATSGALITYYDVMVGKWRVDEHNVDVVEEALENNDYNTLHEYCFYIKECSANYSICVGADKLILVTIEHDGDVKVRTKIVGQDDVFLSKHEAEKFLNQQIIEIIKDVKAKREAKKDNE